MISVAGTIFGFAWPVFLAAIPIGLGALVYLFRAKGTAQPQVTSTLFLLSRMPQFTPSRRRFVPPLQFWLELALVGLLAFGASGLKSSETGRRVALVVDNSKSMGARVTADETRLELAIRIASADATQASPEITFSIRSAAPQRMAPGIDSARTRLRGRDAVDALRGLQPTYEVDDLAATISGLLASREFDSVWVYTDRAFQGLGASERLRVTTVPFDPDVVHNTWISSVQVLSDEKSSKESIDVGIGRVGPDTHSEAVVIAQCTDRKSGRSFTVSAETNEVQSHSARSVRLGPIEQPWSYCRLALGESGGDFLPQDDDAWVVRGADTERIGLVSEMPVSSLGLDRIPYGIVVPFDGKNGITETDLRAVMYHRTVPTKNPRSATMVVYPQTGATLWGGAVGAEAAKLVSSTADMPAVEITRWDESHPILQYVRPGLLSIPSARVLECPTSSEAVIYSSSGPIMCAGEEGGLRYVVIGFEVFPFEGLRTPTLSIVTLNAIQWLTEGAMTSHTGYISPGVMQVPRVKGTVAQAVRFIAPGEEAVSVSQAGAINVVKPGVLEIVGGSVPDDEGRLLAVNAISDQESNLLLKRPIQVSPHWLDLDPSSSEGATSTGAYQQISRVTRNESTNYEGVLAWCALFVLAGDMIRRLLTRSGWGERV